MTTTQIRDYFSCLFPGSYIQEVTLNGQKVLDLHNIPNERLKLATQLCSLIASYTVIPHRVCDTAKFYK